MAIKDEIESIYKIYKNKWKRILSLTFGLWIALPSIKIGFWGIIYTLLKSEWVNNKFTEVFTEGIIPDYLSLIINPFNEIKNMVLVCFLVTLFFYLKDNVA